jgi:uroporphyrinogen-III synthase
MKTVFISRTATPAGPLHKFCAANNLRLVDQSLLAFKGVCPDEEPVQTDVIFFTSPRSVRFYFTYFKYNNELLASIGESTANELKKYNLTADFIGTAASNPNQVAREFKAWLGNRTVLFPQSQRSNRTMQRELNSNQYSDLVVYETHLESIKFKEPPNYLVFTSPSNAESYLLSNEITNDQFVLSFGTTTADYLTRNGIKNNYLKEPTEEAVVLEMKKL